MGVLLLCAVLAFQGCFDPVYPQLDRDARIMEALAQRDGKCVPPSPLTPSQAVAYALANNLEAKVAEIEIAYQNESAVAARRRLLPSLTLRYSMDHSNHPSARWSESTRTGSQSLESSFSADPNSRLGDVGLMWNLIDFGVGYLRSRQQGERILHSRQQRRRIRQQVVLEVLSAYWRASAAETIAREAESLRKELDDQAAAIRDSVEMRILSGAEGARRELVVHGGLAELEQWRRAATQTKLDLGRVMGCGSALGFRLAEFPQEPPRLPPLPNGDPGELQTIALQRRPELYQHDAQERIAVDEARIALLQMAPNANLSLNVYDDPDKFLEWGNWMTVGARVSWNLFNIPARLSERRMAKLQEQTAKQKGLATAAAIIAQVGIAYSEWRLSHDYAKTLGERAAARQRLVDALAAGEKDNQTRPGEVLQERVRLLTERAASLRANAEARVAGARLANALGLDADQDGNLLWNPEATPGLVSVNGSVSMYPEVRKAEDVAATLFPDELSGLMVVKPADFMTPEHSFLDDGGLIPGPAVESWRGKAPQGGYPAQAPTPKPAPEKPADSIKPQEPAPPRPERPLPDKPMPENGKSEQPRYEVFPKSLDRKTREEEGGGDKAPPKPSEIARRRTGGRRPPPRPSREMVLDEFDPEVMMELAKTSYSEPVSATRITERSPVRIILPKMPARSLVEVPEDLQAQAAPDMGFGNDVKKPPVTSFVGPEPWERRTPEAIAPPKWDLPPEGMLRPIELPELLPEPAFLTPPPLDNRPLTPPVTTQKVVLRPPDSGGKRLDLSPPAASLSPGDFGEGDKWNK